MPQRENTRSLSPVGGDMQKSEKAGVPILPTEHLLCAYSTIGTYPINTVEHFRDAASRYRFNAVKCDVRPTADDRLICCHDAGFTLDSDGRIISYNRENAVPIRSLTAADCLSLEHAAGYERLGYHPHPCLVEDMLRICRDIGKVAFVTIRDEYMDVVIPTLLQALRHYYMTEATIINSMTLESLQLWRGYDRSIMLNYTLRRDADVTAAAIDAAVELGHCSVCAYGYQPDSTEPQNACDFAYAHQKNIRLFQAICSCEGSLEAALRAGYDGAQISYPYGQSLISRIEALESRMGKSDEGFFNTT